MKKIKDFLINEKKDNLFYVICLLFAWSAFRALFLSKSFRHQHDYFTAILYTIVIFWTYYSLLYKVTINENTDEKILIKRCLSDVEYYRTRLIELAILFLFGTPSYLIYHKTGVIFITLLITISCVLTLSYLLYNYRTDINEILKNRNERGNNDSKFNTLPTILIFFAGIIFIYLIPWRVSFCSEYGVEEIGHFFEKNSYKTKYLVKISRVNGEKTYTLPAEIFVSKSFSEYEGYETTRGVGVYSTDEEESMEIRYVKIIKVFFENGGFLYFNCLVPIDDSQTCEDQDGAQWEIKLTETKIE